MKPEYDAFRDAIGLLKRSIQIIGNIGKIAVLLKAPIIEKMALDGLDELEIGLDKILSNLNK